MVMVLAAASTVAPVTAVKAPPRVEALCSVTAEGAAGRPRMIMPLMPPELSSISANHRYSPALMSTTTDLG